MMAFFLTLISSHTLVESPSITHLLPGKSGTFFTSESGEEIPKIKFPLDERVLLSLIS